MTRLIAIVDDQVLTETLRGNLADDFTLSAMPLRGTEPASLENVGPADLFLLQFDEACADEAEALLEWLRTRVPRIPAMAISSVANAELIIRAMRAGVEDFVRIERAGGEDVAARIRQTVRQAGASAGGPDSRGKLFTVLGSSPSQSVAFMAAHLALATAENAEPGKRVLLLDAASPPGASLVLLDIKQAYSLGDALTDVHRCDQTLIDTAFPRHPDGIFVLSQSEEQIGAPVIEAPSLANLVSTLRNYFAYIFVAADSLLPLDCLSTLIDKSTYTLVRSDQSILHSRRAQALVQALREREVPLSHLVLVVDHFVRNLGLDPEKLAGLLEVPLATIIGGRRQVRIQAQNTGESLFTLAPKDAYAVGVRQLAVALMNGELQMPLEGADKASFFSRLLG